VTFLSSQVNEVFIVLTQRAAHAHSSTVHCYAQVRALQEQQQQRAADLDSRAAALHSDATALSVLAVDVQARDAALQQEAAALATARQHVAAEQQRLHCTDWSLDSAPPAAPFSGAHERNGSSSSTSAEQRLAQLRSDTAAAEALLRDLQTAAQQQEAANKALKAKGLGVWEGLQNEMQEVRALKRALQEEHSLQEQRLQQVSHLSNGFL
jgi:hypothetical protein